jgi:hypothetical protein
VPNFTAASSPDLMRPHGRLGTAQLLGYLLKDLQVLALCSALVTTLMREAWRPPCYGSVDTWWTGPGGS